MKKLTTLHEIYNEKWFRLFMPFIILFIIDTCMIIDYCVKDSRCIILYGAFVLSLLFSLVLYLMVKPLLLKVWIFIHTWLMSHQTKRVFLELPHPKGIKKYDIVVMDDKYYICVKKKSFYLVKESSYIIILNWKNFLSTKTDEPI